MIELFKFQLGMRVKIIIPAAFLVLTLSYRHHRHPIALRFCKVPPSKPQTCRAPRIRRSYVRPPESGLYLDGSRP